MHGHRHRRGGGRLGGRFYERERVLERLENYQRDLEQELADVSDLHPQAQGREGRDADEV